MELLLLTAYGEGYRGCVVEEHRYLFFQYSRKRGLKHLKSYPKEDFNDISHFIAMMQKFVSPPSFLQPPVPIKALTVEELNRVHTALKSSGRG